MGMHNGAVEFTYLVSFLDIRIVHYTITQLSDTPQS
jgi:hypothetical protein